MQATTVFAPLWSMIMLGGLSGLPLSVPPLAEDPALARVAPAECLWYMSAAGMATPDANSPNQTEQLLAEPEIRALASEVERLVLLASRRGATGGNELILATEILELVKIALTHPLAAYVADVLPNADGGPPRIQAGLVVKLGERADEVTASLNTLLALVFGGESAPRETEGDWHVLPLPPDAPPVRLGVSNGYLVIGIGDGEAERIADQLAAQGGPPAWLEDARRQLPIERRSTMGYLNVAEILARVQPLFPAEQALVPEHLGLTNVEAIITSTGMDDAACVTKGLIAIDGRPRGVFALLPHEPLAPEDLAVVPADATVAFALRLNARETLDGIVDLVSRFEPQARQQFEEGLWQAERELGVDLRNDVLGSLDDRLVVYMPGGELFTAWTGASATVTIKDRRRLERAIDKLTVAARMHTEGFDGGRPSVRLRESEFGDYTLHYLQFVGEAVPFSPAWCVTDRYLVAGLTPQSVKEAIGRASRGGESLADAAAVQAALSVADGPAWLTFVDTQKLVRGLYPLLMWGLQAAAGEMAREGFDIDLAAIPSVETVARHLVPTVSTWRLSPEGYRFESQQSLPGGDLVSSAPIAIALLLPAVQSARGAAQASQEMNQLRQLALAFHNYTDVHGRFPSNIYDEDGNALLSWRVQLLPYLEEQPLYEQFRLNEPWDSPHNRPLLERMPAVFTSASSPLPPGRTRFVALVHENSLFPGDKRLHFADVVDGTSNTIMYVQAAPESAVEWTRPDDLTFDPENPQEGLMQQAGHFLAAFADGSVQRIFLGDEETLRRMVFRNDGMPIER